MTVPIEKRALAWALAAAMLSLGGAWLAASPIKWAASTTPALTARATPTPSPAMVPSPQLLAQGGAYFGQSCGDCHGDDGHGDEGPDLHSLAISNARIARQIKNGTKDEMPSFAKKYNDQQIAALVAYVRSLK